MRPSHVFYRSAEANPSFAVGGAGMYLFDRDGRRYLDSCSGVAVSSLGHNHPRVIAAIKRQADQLSYVHSGVLTTAPAEELAAMLAARAPAMSKVYFLSGGSEIVELCLKTAYQYQVEIGQPDRNLFVSRRQSYHGSTLGALSISGNLQRRGSFDPILGRCTLVSPCYAYRGKLPGEPDRDYAIRLGRELEDRILELGPHRVAAFVAETVVGSTSGAVPPVDGYFREIRAVCDRYGVLLVLDEVMAGSGRTGHHFAYAEDDVAPDIVAIGKGLAAGYLPISAMLANERVHAAIANGSGSLNNGQTFVNHPLACAAALAVQQTIVDEGLLDNVLARGEQLRKCLHDAFDEHPYVGDIRGRGLFVGVELVADRSTKEPFAPENQIAPKLRAAALREGMMTYPMSGTIDGRRGEHVLIAPPFICTEDDIGQLVTRLSTAFAAVFSSSAGP